VVARTRLSCFLTAILVCSAAGTACSLDPTAFRPENAQFGFTAGGRFLCQAFDLPSSAEPESDLDLRGMAVGEEDGFRLIPAGGLPASWQARLGDTLQTVVYGKVIRMVIDAYGWFETECWQAGLVYSLAPVDSLASSPGFDEGFLIAPLDDRMRSEIVPYYPCDSVPRDAQKALSSLVTDDFCAALMADQVERMKRGSRRPDAPLDTHCSLQTTVMRCYSADRSSPSDELFVTLQYDMGSTEATWFELVLLHWTTEGIQCRSLLGPGPGDWRFVLDSSLDLDGDGCPEFFIINSHSTSLWRLVNGELILVRSGPYRGC